MNDNRVRAALVLAIAIVIAAFLIRSPRYEFYYKNEFQFDPQGGHIKSESFWRFDLRSGKAWSACSTKARDAGICKDWVAFPASDKIRERLKEVKENE